MRNKYLVLNTGSTSTKVTVYLDTGERIFDQTQNYDAQQIQQYPHVQDQFEFRCAKLDQILRDNDIHLDEMLAIGGRGGTLIPIYEGGTYEVDEFMCQYLIDSPVEHAANLSAQLARYLADQVGIKAYVVDPDVLDEMSPIARITGLKGCYRSAQWHGCSQKAITRLLAKELGKDVKDINVIVLHIGGGISVGLHMHGRTVDVTNCIHGDGPFSPERAGSMPTLDVLDLAYKRGLTYEEAKKELVGKGGLVSHLGTNDAREVERMIDAGDEYAQLVYSAMAYNFARWVGAMAACGKGQIDAIGITGGLAYSRRLMDELQEYIGFIAPVYLFPGEREMDAIYEGVKRVVDGKEEPKLYRVKERPAY